MKWISILLEYVLLNWLTQIILELLLCKGLFPEKLKKAKVTVICRVSHVLVMRNYRPISVLQCFVKVLERIIDNNCRNTLMKTIYSKQFGFQKRYSMEHAIIQLVDKLLPSLEENKLKQAFSLVDHKKLIMLLLRIFFIWLSVRST